MEHRKIRWPGLRRLNPFLQSRWRKAVRDASCGVEVAREGLERIRKHYKFSTSELAELLGCSVSALRSWQNGQRKPSVPVRRLILLAEQALEQLPPGEWRRIVWGWPLAGIIAFRKGEVVHDFKSIEEKMTRRRAA